MAKPKFSLRPIHPGKTLVAELESRKMTPEQFSEKSGIPTQTVRSFLNGKILLETGDIRKLANAIGPSDRFWSNMQRTFIDNGGSL